MGAVWARARSELRRRWRAAAALALLVGITGGVVLFGVAGSRRTFSALDRFVAYTHPVDAFIYGEDLDLAAVEALPLVVDADSGTYFLMAPGTPSGEPDPSLGINPVSSSQGRLLTSIDRPMVVSGHLPDPNESLEVAVNEELAEARGLAPGDSLVMWGYAADQFFELLEAPGTVQPEGPRVELTVTAVVRHPRDVTPYATDDEVVYLSKQNLFLTPAFHHRYVDEVANFDQAVGASLGVRLARGHADLAAFTESVRALPGGESAEVDPDTSSHQALAAGQRAIELQAMALLGFAALLAMAAVAVVGQSLARQVQLEAVEHPALRALGMSRGQLVAVLVVQALVVGLVGAALAVAVAVGLS
ncbi:MAG TPA: FtsX-like permease family protein, partial [Acidimicrobiales bacterium]|nr:FtsX-like permease family protein [Acidimicrobiales bacterium]